MYISPGVVVGFHGCDQKIFDEVIKNGSSIAKSENDYDWLGHGIYFWENDYERALDWAKNKDSIDNPTVIGAFIKLGHCVDLLDSQDINKVATTYQILKNELDKVGKPLPKNRVISEDITYVRELDCKVMLRLQQLNNDLIAEDLKLTNHSAPENKRKIQKHPNFIDSVRGMFPEGSHLYDGAGFRERNHIQLCIINPNCILGYFEPRKANSWFKQL
ncbi:hypothetical protein BB427_16740 [Pseudoalteromonas sp. BMB]|uniref:hypothetical protein n=1 Tax=Pseudoalteromonas sp. BMB TaxID=1874619 RepID=UPI00083DEE72|nr:hypothetical protein [Pseudoalteromonas sp. BMB]ODB35757.1 hypothetical protein BB427_16740 [Pseudoalteromonas sp. BMB]